MKQKSIREDEYPELKWIGWKLKSMRESFETVLNEMKKQDSISKDLMDLIASPENLEIAKKKVKSNKGAPGIDGVSVEEIEEHIEEYQKALLYKVREGTYKPTPVKRVYIPKDNGDKRALGIPVVRDRIVQQMILNVLDPMIDPYFSENSYGFRKNRSCHDAVNQVLAYANEGYTWVVNCDLEKFFDTVNHQKLMSYLNYYVKDKKLNKLLWSFLEAGVMEDGVVMTSEKGTPQGGVISPFLSNIYLNILDLELEKRGHKFVRYADDFNIMVKSKRAGERVLVSITKFIEKTLKLKVNREKSSVVYIGKMKYLGFGFRKHKDEFKCFPHKTAKEKFKRRLKELTSRKRPGNFIQITKEINRYTVGWINYFGIGQMKTYLKEISGWLNRRLRQLCLKRWKKIKTRYEMLKTYGIDDEAAYKFANSRKGYWRLSCTMEMHFAISKERLAKWGLKDINQLYQSKYSSC